jgi:hypothetical protein
MNKNDYLNILKGTELRPKKIKPAIVNQTYLAEQNERGEADLHSAIMKFFATNSKPTVNEIDAFLKTMGMNKDEFHNHLYMMIGSVAKGKNNLNEIFIQTGEIEAMDTGDRKNMAMLRLSMIAELDASNLYERFADLTDDEAIKKTMLDISNEEKVHAGEFKRLLEESDPEAKELTEEGEDEVEDLNNF